MGLNIDNKSLIVTINLCCLFINDLRLAFNRREKIRVRNIVRDGYTSTLGRNSRNGTILESRNYYRKCEKWIWKDDL